MTSTERSTAALAAQLAELRALTGEAATLREEVEVLRQPARGGAPPAALKEQLFSRDGGGEGPAGWNVSSLAGFRAQAAAGFRDAQEEASAPEPRTAAVRRQLAELRRLAAEGRGLAGARGERGAT